MGKPTGFMDYKSQHMHERNPLERIQDFGDLYLPLSDQELQQQGARCMDCAVPFCQTGDVFSGQAVGCPVHNQIPEWNDLIYRGQWREALHRLHQTNNFPEFTGRACPAPCEGSCVASLYESPVTIKNIERAIIDKGFEEGWVVPSPPSKRTGKTVAIIGSGPAGLTCADELNKLGHRVTVFERHDRVGGLLTYGIPRMKIEQYVVERRVELLRQVGIMFVTNSEIGKDITFAMLQEQFDAVVVCIGATKPRDLLAPGRELKGIHYAMDFLHANTKSLLDSNLQDGQYISAEGKDVIVIGGGDTAIDCVSTALRHNCRSLTQFDIHERKPDERDEDNNPWPGWPIVHKCDYGLEEATELYGHDPRQFALMTKEFISDGAGNVTGVRTVQLQVTKDADGKLIRKEDAGTERVWEAQLVLLAIGFSGPENHLLNTTGIHTNHRSNIETAHGQYATNIEGVFAAGDARRGSSLIVWAIQEGREAAKACDQYLAECVSSKALISESVSTI
ncbi:glutamate synthase subunit beta [Paenibacillus albiflavus]|uniref:Glutamate synthase subunit beta n=1 Tax=Paenibacillus albiflavus TaxID=2545760 RepID=A0A4R4ED43_9BACL|nr:glutamate synthase subunit beta [Paenibacillus albiflavus]TCZ77113.1 glutamate synthase subunit beta [Paenibacillus albiflavus]